MSYIGSTPTTQSFIAGTDYFNGTGSAINFTLSRSVNSVNDIEVIVNNVEQIPSGYSVSGTTLTFSVAPSTGTSNIYVRYLSTTNLSLAIPSGTSATFNTLAYTGTLTGGTGVVNIGSGQFVKDASGNVGLGVTPSAWAGFPALQIKNGAIYGAGTTDFGSVQNGYFSSGWKYIASSVPAALYSQSSGVHAWSNAPSGTAGNAITFTQAMTLDASGNLLVGATAPAGYRLSVGSASSTYRSDSTLAASTGWYHFYGTSSSNGVANISIYGNGSIQNALNSYGALSDIKLKENIVDATPKLDALNQVRVVNYNLIGDDQKQIGVIAQELEQIFPGMIDEAPDRDEEGGVLETTTKSVKYSVFVPILIKAIQEQQALITTLTERITALEAK